MDNHFGRCVLPAVTVKKRVALETKIPPLPFIDGGALKSRDFLLDYAFLRWEIRFVDFAMLVMP